MKRFLKATALLVILCAVCTLVACGKNDGNTSPSDPTGPNGPSGPSGPTVTVEGAIVRYFVGEPLDTSKGSIKIVENGEQTIIPFSDAGVTFQGFDTTAVQEKSVTVSYTKADKTYTAAYTITVEIGQVSLRAPTKTTYKNYEQLDLTGGCFLFTSADGERTRTVPLTAEMVTGFDPSAVNEASGESEQTLTATYAGQQRQFTVTLAYSYLPSVQSTAAALSAVDWSPETGLPQLSAQDGEDAVVAYERYTMLDATDRALVSADELHAIVRAAAYHCGNVWRERFAAYADTFAVREGELAVCGASYAKAKEDAAITDDAALLAASDLLIALSADYADVKIYETVTVADMRRTVCDRADITAGTQKLSYLLSLYEALPAECTQENANEYATEIEALLAALDRSAHKTDRALHATLDVWRHGYFDILYTYAYLCKEQTPTHLSCLAQVRFPQALEEAFEALQSAYAQAELLASSQTTDGTALLCGYTIAEQRLSAADANAVYAWIADTAAPNGITLRALFEKVRDGVQGEAVGYVDLAGGMRDDEAFDAMRATVAAAVEKYGRGDPLESEIPALFDAFVSLSPARQYAFMNAVCVGYDSFVQSSDRRYLFDCGADLASPYAQWLQTGEDTHFHSLFAALCGYYYYGKLGADIACYNTLMGAVEDFAAGDVPAFMAKVATLKNTTLSAAFTEHLGDVLTKLTDIAAIYTPSGEVVAPAEPSGESAQRLTSLRTAFAMLAYADACVAAEIETVEPETDESVLSLRLAAFAHAEQLVKTIETAARTDAALSKAYYFETTFPLAGKQKTGDAVWAYRRNLYRTHTAAGGDAYLASNLPTFLGSGAYGVLSPYYTSLTGGAADYSQEAVTGALDAFLALSDDDRILLDALDTQRGGFYARALDDALYNVLSNAYNAGAALITVSYAYSAYLCGGDPEFLVLQEAWDSFMNHYSAMPESETYEQDEALFQTYLGKMYAFYAPKCEELFSA